MKKEKEPKVQESPINSASVKATLESVAQSVVGTQSSYMHSMILLDHLFRLPNAREIFNDDLKDQARDLWLKLKSTGLQLNDPPLLFESNKN